MSLGRSGTAYSGAFRVPALVIMALIVSGTVLLLCGLSGIGVTGEDTDVVKAFASSQYTYIYTYLCEEFGSSCKTSVLQYDAGSESGTIANSVQFLTGGLARTVTSIAFVLKECLNTFTVLGMIAFAMAGLLDAYNSKHPRTSTGTH